MFDSDKENNIIKLKFKIYTYQNFAVIKKNEIINFKVKSFFSIKPKQKYFRFISDDYCNDNNYN